MAIKIRFFSDAYKPKRASHRLRGEVTARALAAQGYDAKILTDWSEVDADTVVILNDHIIGKPIHREEAVSMLLSLSGVTHQVITGVVLLQGDREISFSQTTSVTFHPLTLSQIEHYVDHYKPYDKAGGYAIQEWIGVVGIQSIDGDFYNVMGLPVSLVIQHLQQFRQPIRSN